MQITPFTFQETTVLIIEVRTSDREEIEFIILPRSTFLLVTFKCDVLCRINVITQRGCVHLSSVSITNTRFVFHTSF